MNNSAPAIVRSLALLNSLRDRTDKLSQQLADLTSKCSSLPQQYPISSQSVRSEIASVYNQLRMLQHNSATKAADVARLVDAELVKSRETLRVLTGGTDAITPLSEPLAEETRETAHEPINEADQETVVQLQTEKVAQHDSADLAFTNAKAPKIAIRSPKTRQSLKMEALGKSPKKEKKDTKDMPKLNMTEADDEVVDGEDPSTIPALPKSSSRKKLQMHLNEQPIPPVPTTPPDDVPYSKSKKRKHKGNGILHELNFLEITNVDKEASKKRRRGRHEPKQPPALPDSSLAENETGLEKAEPELTQQSVTDPNNIEPQEQPTKRRRTRSHTHPLPEPPAPAPIAAPVSKKEKSLSKSKAKPKPMPATPTQSKKAKAVPASSPPTPPDEEVFCICRQPSFGQMIACDSPNCKIEWFHMSCVGLKTAPKGSWFCDDCIKLKMVTEKMVPKKVVTNNVVPRKVTKLKPLKELKRVKMVSDKPQPPPARTRRTRQS